MSKYKKVEELLSNYKMLVISIANMEQEIDHLNKEDGMSGIAYDSISTSPTNKFSSSTEDVALSNSEKIHYLEHSIERIKRQIESIDRAMKGLTEIERIIIKERYIEGRQWYVVAYKSDCSESTGKRYRRSAINKLIIGIYGEDKDDRKLTRS